MASCLPHGFCIVLHCFRMASQWSGRFPTASRSLHVGSSLAPNVFSTVRVLCGRFPKHLRSYPQCGSLQDRLWKIRKPWRQAGCPDDAGQCRQPDEGVTKFISASKFCSGPKSWRGKFAFSGRRRNVRKRSGVIKTVKGIFQEYADRLPNHADLYILHSVSCPGLVRALVDA